METAQLYQGIYFLVCTTAVMMILLVGVLIKLIIDLTKLTNNVNETVTIVKTELEPTLKNVNKSVEIISGIIIKADAGVSKVKAFLSTTPFKILGKVSEFTGKATKGFFGGLCTAFKMFSKK